MKENTTEFGSTIAQAIKTDINQYVWKRRSGEEVRLMDMDATELNRAYKHVHEMLYNDDKYVPGKYQTKINMQRLINQCNAELFKRYLIYECNIEALKTPMQIVTLIREYKKQNNLTDSDPVSTLFDHLPQEFESVTYGDLIAACLDQLEVINRKMISQHFILSKGIWLTESEKEELSERDDEGKKRPWLDVVKERCLMPSEVKLRIDPRGFSYSEFRALIHLAPLPKISGLSSDTLRLMRDKVFPMLSEDTDWHIKRWTGIAKQIEEVANYKGIELLKFEK